MVRNRPKRKTRVGQPSRWPLTPKETGTVVPAASGMRRMIPALTRPMKAMKKPIPTTIATLSDSGTALNTAVRKPVSTRMVISTPAHTTRPMMAGQVSPGVEAMVVASSAFTPRPAAMAKGCLATTPMRMVMTPATSAVIAATCGTPSMLPDASLPRPMMRGFSTTM